MNRQDRFDIPLLWTIRKYQPISLDEIMELCSTKPDEIPTALHRVAAYPTLINTAQDFIEQCIELGLLKIVSDKKNPADRQRLKITSNLQALQEIFGFSLTDLVDNGNGILAHPVFGEPIQKRKPWSDVFVAMPFQEDLRPIYSDHILPTIQNLNLTCARGDDFFSGNVIMDEVWSAIYHSKLCIVECTGRNPNVFYELGIAHTLGRKAILMTQNIEDIPFDIRHLRHIVYQFTPRGMKDFEHALSETVKTELLLTPKQ